MKKTDLLSIKYGAGFFEIKATNPQEVKYFVELLGEKLGSGKFLGPTTHNGIYLARLSFSGNVTNEKHLFYLDIEWWLYNVALEKGWVPFGEAGTFIRESE